MSFALLSAMQKRHAGKRKLQFMRWFASDSIIKPAVMPHPYNDGDEWMPMQAPPMNEIRRRWRRRQQ